jgi:hypothetical protein
MPQVHYEIFRQQGRSESWSLVEAVENRATALARAKELLAEGRAAAVRVVKETLQQASGDYISLTIFQDGHVFTKSRKKKKTVDAADMPLLCFKPDDLYSYHARATIARLAADWLSRYGLTVTELLHSAAAIERFEATGTAYQHAIQKIAVAAAADSSTPVQQIIKDLDKLCTAAIARVYKDERRGAFPVVEAGGFRALAQDLSESEDGPYLLNGALAKYLKTNKGWDDKLQKLLLLMDELPDEGPARILLLGSIDNLVSEMLSGAAALSDLLGKNADLGHALLNLVQLFLGERVTAAEGSGAGLNQLARYFARDDLPNARSAIAGRILTELKGMKRLCPGTIEAELKMLRELANRLVRGQGKYLSHEDLIAAFTSRSKRLVAHEPLSEFLHSAKTADERVARLLVVEENVIGAENKRTLAAFMMPLIASSAFEAQLCVGAPPITRLQRVCELQERVLRSGLQEVQKTQIVDALDVVASNIERTAGVLASLEARMTAPADRAVAILKLYAANVFTQGELANKARRMLLAAMAQKEFFPDYMALKQKGREVNRQQVLKELISDLERVGIAPEDGLRTLAA